MTAAMQNYSFNLSNPSGSEQLYRMGQFPDWEHAFCLAELIATELNISDDRKWSGWTMQVRDCEGSLVLSVPLGHDNARNMTNGAFGEARSKQLELCYN
jgi:hypothetical protein